MRALVRERCDSHCIIVLARRQSSRRLWFNVAPKFSSYICLAMASDNYPKLAGARPGPMATPASPPYAHDLLVALHAQHPEQQEGGAVHGRDMEGG